MCISRNLYQEGNYIYLTVELKHKVINQRLIEAMFIFWKVVFEKLLLKFSCVCLSLEKLVNGKYFPVKGKFDLVSRKVFS